jgi:hypothetical protein
MSSKTTLFVSLLFAASTAFAEQNLLESAAKQTAKDAATNAVPATVKDHATAAGQAVEDAKTVKESVGKAPEVLKDQAQDTAKEAVKQKAEQAVPGEVKQGVETLKTGKETAAQLKDKVDAAPKTTGEATKTVKAKAKQKAAEKALDLLQ